MMNANQALGLMASMTPMGKQFAQFVQNFQQMKKDPKQAVQELLDSGEMSQQQYENLRTQANKIMGTNF